MAGPFTHMLLCQRAADPTIAGQHGVHYSPDFLAIIDSHQCFFLMGAVTPDLPAISDKLAQQSWSDEMHNGKLNRAVVPIFSMLKQVGCRDARLAWLFGYVGHVIGDVVVHPVVQEAKKSKPGDSSAHRECEICEDVLLFKDIRSYELTEGVILHKYMDWMNETRSAHNRAMFDQTMAIWRDGLNQHGANFGGDCAGWYSSYIAALDLATALPLFKFDGYLYPKSPSVSAADRRNFYDWVPLPVPQGSCGDFRTAVVDLAVKQLATKWQAMWTCLTDGQPGGIEALIPDWDLNTGENRTEHRANDLWV
jgi:hypothetical protein